MYNDVADPSTGAVVKTAAQVEAEVETELIAAGVDPALAARVRAEGVKPLTDGNLLHELIVKGYVTPTTLIDFTAASRGGGSATFTVAQIQKKWKHASDFGVSGLPTRTALSA